MPRRPKANLTRVGVLLVAGYSGAIGGCIDPHRGYESSGGYGHASRPMYGNCSNLVVDGRDRNGDTALALFLGVPLAIWAVAEVIQWICEGCE